MYMNRKENLRVALNIATISYNSLLIMNQCLLSPFYDIFGIFLKSDVEIQHDILRYISDSIN